MKFIAGHFAQGGNSITEQPCGVMDTVCRAVSEAEPARMTVSMLLFDMPVASTLAASWVIYYQKKASNK